MTLEDNGTSDRLVIEIEMGWQINKGNFDALYLARIFKMTSDPRWPHRRQKPVVVLCAEEPTAESALQQVLLWIQAGRPDASEAKARVEAQA